MAIFSCKGCPDRHPGCHSTCQKYLEEKAQYEELRAENAKKRAIEYEIYSQRSERVYKATKRRRR
jgi:hypothetical protein